MEEQQKRTHRRLRPIVWVLLAAVILLACALIVRLSGCADKPAETEPAETEVPEAAAETPEPEPEVMTAEFFFTGDALIHGTVWMDADQGNGTYDFSGIVENVGRLAEGYDLKYYNQETILGGTELGLHGYPTFNSPQEVGDAMVNMGFGLVSTANNHSLDQGLTGIERSTEYWKRQEAEHGVHMAGTYSSQEDHDRLDVYEVNGITYTFLSWTYGCNGLLPPEGYEYIVNIYPEHVDELLEQVRQADAISDVVIVAMHWGTEYYMEANDEQRELAQKLSEAGADIIVGNHPHVIQPIEWVNDHKTIVYYAMGNMVSAQIDEPNLVGMVGGVTIQKTVNNGETSVEIKDPRADLIYTYYDPGYITGMAEMVHASCGKLLAEEFGAVVCSPDYALMPYPIPLEDCAAALEYMLAHAAELGIDPDRIVIGGESAGGGLAAALCLYARDRGIRVRMQIPLYPMLDCRDTESSRDNHGHIWNTKRNHFGWKRYLRLLDERGSVPGYASAASEKDLSGLPACYTFVLDGEPFYAETLDYVRRLKKAGVYAQADVYHGNVHAFDMMTPWTANARTARKKLCGAWRRIMEETSDELLK